jgi:hypothetical protein
MSRRNDKGEILSADSFLDVIANMVGILIILIVIVGVRVKTGPLVAKTEVEESVRPAPIVVEPEVSSEEADPDYYPPLAFADEPVELPPAPLPLPPLAVPAALSNEADRLDEELARLRGQRQLVEQQLIAAREKSAELREAIERKRQLLGEQEALLTERRDKQSAEAEELEALRRQLLEMSQMVRQVEATSPSAKSLEHRVTPIGKMVEGVEHHFRVSNQRVSVIPLEPLIDRLRGQVERRRDTVLKTSRYVGTVGPIEGYVMEYTIERQGTSVLDELRYGTSVFRIAITEWTLQPQNDLPAETAQQALSAGSRFQQSLSRGRPGGVLTFWVYPDSFETFRELQKFAHEHGFLVAGRPLPTGVPISGSPNGSRSSAQ